MTITKEAARKALLFLKGCPGNKLFDALTESDGYLFSKHLDKAKALAAAVTDRQKKGYFKKEVTTQVPNLAAYKDLTERQRKHVVGLGHINKKGPTGKNFGGTDSSGEARAISTTQTQAMSTSDFATLLSQCIGISLTEGTLFEANNGGNTRFLCVVSIPKRYVGRSITSEGLKNKDLKHAVVIVVAPEGPKKDPYILNFYPADDLYLKAQVALQ